MAKRGRPPLPRKEGDERKNALVSIPSDAKAALEEIGDKLEKDLGFRPTNGQIILALIKKGH